MTNEQKQTIASMRDSGVPITSIAQQLELSVNTIKSYCKRHGIHSGNQSSKNILFCLQCHKEIPQTSHRKEKKFCSDKCRQLWWAENSTLIPRNSQIERICPVCKTSFFTKASTVFTAPVPATANRRRSTMIQNNELFDKMYRYQRVMS